MKTIHLGIVPAPGFSTQISENLKQELAESLNKEISDTIHWSIEIKVDKITGAADNIQEIMDQAMKIKTNNGWDYVISLTDLPIFSEKFIVLADANKEENAAQISLPAFGTLPTVINIKKTMVRMTKELYYTENGNKHTVFLKNGIGINENKGRATIFQRFQRIFRLSSIERKDLKERTEGVSVRFLIHPKWNGNFKLIAGMTIANSPWSIMPSFKKVIGLAFATGCYMLIFNTLWKLSGLYGYPRFITLMLTAMIAMVTWIIFAHNLWEKKKHYKSSRLRMMYNATTITTLSVSVLLFYISMFILFSMAVLIFVPGDIFKEVLNHHIEFIDYAKLAWLVTSAATVAGAIGAGLENEEAVRKITYGYRQYIRSKEIQRKEIETEKKEQGKESKDYNGNQ